MRILLVEDDEMIGHSLREALTEMVVVDWVKDGLLAQSALADGDYACVLLDLGLPRRSRWRCCAARARGQSHAGAGADRARRPRRPRRRPRPRRRRLPGEALRVARAAGAHARGDPPRDGSAHSVIGTGAHASTSPRARCSSRGRRRALGARVRAAARAAGAARRDPVARPAGKPHLRLGRGSEQQRRRRADPRHAAQARRRRHPQRARPRLARQPGRRMKSLRRQLLMWLVPMYLVGAVVGGRSARTYMYGVDGQSSWTASAGVRRFACRRDGPAPALRPLSDHDVEKGAIDRADLGPRRPACWRAPGPALALPMQAADGFRRRRVGLAVGWRVYSLHTPDRTVQSAQSLELPRARDPRAGAAGGPADRCC